MIEISKWMSIFSTWVGIPLYVFTCMTVLMMMYKVDTHYGDDVGFVMNDDDPLWLTLLKIIPIFGGILVMSGLITVILLMVVGMGLFGLWGLYHEMISGGGVATGLMWSGLVMFICLLGFAGLHAHGSKSQRLWLILAGMLSMMIFVIGLVLWQG